MANEYKWIISQLSYYSQHEGQQDVVFMVDWRREATDGTNTVSIFGNQFINFDPAVPFTPYAELTEQQIIAWLEDAFGAEKLAAQIANLDKQLADKINPPVIVAPPPWQA